MWRLAAAVTLLAICAPVILVLPRSPTSIDEILPYVPVMAVVYVALRLVARFIDGDGYNRTKT